MVDVWADLTVKGHTAPMPLRADERRDIAAGFWLRADAWFTECGTTVRKVLTDNRSAICASLR